jgi:Fe-S-cluster containining protein
VRDLEVGPPGSHPDCADCLQYCCHQLNVHVSAADIARLAKRLDVPAEAFLELRVMARSSADSFLLSPTGAEYELVLCRRERDAQGNASCVFLLVMQDGRSRCGVYEDRPRVCRVYPFYLEGDQPRLDASHLCPPELMDLAKAPGRAVRAAFMRKVVERDAHRLAIDRWNHHVAAEPDGTAHDTGDLLAYLFSAAAATEPVLAPVLADEASLETWAAASLATFNPLLPRHGYEVPEAARATEFQAMLNEVRDATGAP